MDVADSSVGFVDLVDVVLLVFVPSTRKDDTRTTPSSEFVTLWSPRGIIRV